MNALKTLAAICAVCTFAFVSCTEKEDDTVKKKRVECTAESSYDVLAVSPSSVSFDITANTPWEIECNSQWCTFSPASSAESSLSETILVRFEDNLTESPREAVMTIRGVGVDSPVTILFKQEVKGELSITPITGAFPKEGGVKTFTVLSNKDWVASTSASWLTLSPSSGSASDTPVTVTATATSVGIQQEVARITITTVDAVESFDVTIEGYNLSFGDIEYDAIPFMGGTYNLPVTADIEYAVQVTPENDGVTAEKNNQGVVLTVGQNRKFKAREVSVKLVPADPNFAALETSLTFNQGHMLKKDSYDNVVINEDGSATFTGVADKAIQVELKEGFKYGCYTWTLADYNLTAGGFTSNTWWYVNPEPISESTKNFMLMIQVSPTEQKLGTGGAALINNKKVSFGHDNGWQNSLWNDTKSFSQTISDLASIRTIRLLIIPGKREGTNQNHIIIKKLWIDDTLVVDWMDNSGDIWQAGSTIPGIPYAFGIQNAAGTLTIDSFEIDTDYEKYLNE
jgi:hypothetical protein